MQEKKEFNESEKCALLQLPVEKIDNLKQPVRSEKRHVKIISILISILIFLAISKTKSMGKFLKKDTFKETSSLQQKVLRKKVQKKSKDEKKYSLQKENHKIKEITDLNQIYNFGKQGKIFLATSALKNDRNQVLFKQFGDRQAIGKVTVVVTTSKDSKYLKETLNTFFNFNSYKVEKIVVVKDGEVNKQIKDLKQVYSNITWIVTNKKIGQLAAIDVAYSLIQTEYYFHLEDDWVFMKSGFIQFSLHIYSIFPNVSNVWLFKLASFISKTEQPLWKPITFKQNSFAGYNFNPSLHKLKDYSIWPGGFSNMTFFATFGQGAGIGQLIISTKFSMAGKHTVISNIDFIRHVGVTNQGGEKYTLQKFKQSISTEKLREEIEIYYDWVQKQEIHNL